MRLQSRNRIRRPALDSVGLEADVLKEQRVRRPKGRLTTALFYLERLADKRNSFLPIRIVPSKSLSTAVPRTTYFLSPSVMAPRKIAPLSEPSSVASPLLLFTPPVIFAPSCVTLHCSVKMPSIVLWIVTFQFPTILAGGAAAAAWELATFFAAVSL